MKTVTIIVGRDEPATLALARAPGSLGSRISHHPPYPISGVWITSKQGLQDGLVFPPSALTIAWALYPNDGFIDSADVIVPNTDPAAAWRIIRDYVTASIGAAKPRLAPAPVITLTGPVFRVTPTVEYLPPPRRAPPDVSGDVDTPDTIPPRSRDFVKTKRFGEIQLFTLIKLVAESLRMDPALALALIHTESEFKIRAINKSSGASGLGQLMPDAALEMHVDDRFNAEQNVIGSLRYLQKQSRKFGDINLALAAYRSGPGNVQNYGISKGDRHYIAVITRRTAMYRLALADEMVAEGP